MNLNLLRRAARWAQKIAVAERQLADELAEALVEAEASIDPLGTYLLEARRRYRRTSKADKSKDGKRIEMELERSYVEAMNLGFKGSFSLWMSIMRMGKAPEELAHEELAGSPPQEPSPR